MKRILAAMVVFVLLATLSFNTAFAASGNYVLDDLDLQVVIPSGYAVITRDTPATAAIFNRLTMSKAELDSLFVASNIYLNAISDTHNEEIVMIMSPARLDDFHTLSDAVLNLMMSMSVEQYAANGVDVIEYDIYHHAQAKFVRTVFAEKASAVFGVQYYTMYGGKTYHFAIRSYEGELTARQKKVIQEIVDSVVFSKESPVERAVKESNGFTHTDLERGVTFTVPAGWREKALSKEREILKVKFVSDKPGDGIIMFGHADMWEQMTLLERLLNPRATLNNSAVTKEEIADICGTTADKISLVYYNGIEYFRGEMVAGTVTMTVLYHVKNGIMYMFQFAGDEKHVLYGELEKLLESVHIPGSN